MSGTNYFAEQFGLRTRPFTLLPDPDFLFWTRSHKKAFSVLEYGVMTRAPITVITGEVGAGKTTLLQKLLRNMESDVTIGLISNAQGGRGDLLQWVLGALDIACSDTAPYVAKFQSLQNFVLDEYAAGRHVLLIIDEAQNLSVEGLEELRMLTNINSGRDELLQLILVGQPELRHMISRHELRQFAQRVSASYHIPAMDAETTRAYVDHRLRHAGGHGGEYSDAAVAMIHAHSGGVPRLVNKLCDFAMVYAVTNDRTEVDEETVREVLEDSFFIVTEDDPDADPDTRTPPSAPPEAPAPKAPVSRPKATPTLSAPLRLSDAQRTWPGLRSVGAEPARPGSAPATRKDE